MEAIVRILDEELGALFPTNPRGEVTAIMTDGVLHVLARAVLRHTEADLAMARHEIAKLQAHEFAVPTDERGCCAVCHEPVDYPSHQPFTLRAELHRMTGLWYGACAARTEKSVEIAELRKRLAALEGTDHAA